MCDVCPGCRSERIYVISTDIAADKQRRRRYECRVCLERWTCHGNKLIVIHEYDRDVPADQGCRRCGHYSRGVCSLGIPESRLPGFVTECEARLVEEALVSYIDGVLDPQVHNNDGVFDCLCRWRRGDGCLLG